MSDSGLEALLEDREGSVVPPGCPGVFVRAFQMSGSPYRMAGSCREALQDVRKWLGGPAGCLRVFERVSRMSGSGPEGLLDVREWS